MSDEYEGNFGGPNDAETRIRAAVGYLLREAAGSARADIVREIIAIVNEVAHDLPPSTHRKPRPDCQRRLNI
jgi:3-methyladenine DNA glycosylase AlkD